MVAAVNGHAVEWLVGKLGKDNFSMQSNALHCMPQRMLDSLMGGHVVGVQVRSSLFLCDKLHGGFPVFESGKPESIAIKTVKDFFQDLFAERMSLLRVTAPLFVDPASGLNDDLNGVERPVDFDIADGNRHAQINAAAEIAKQGHRDKSDAEKER